MKISENWKLETSILINLSQFSAISANFGEKKYFFQQISVNFGQFVKGDRQFVKGDRQFLKGADNLKLLSKLAVFYLLLNS